MWVAFLLLYLRLLYWKECYWLIVVLILSPFALHFPYGCFSLKDVIVGSGSVLWVFVLLIAEIEKVACLLIMGLWVGP
uniref:Uncharacterized protein n=1 Tax=Lotus japonicus TaxID=34305 RepID=I3T1M9_LOTJA|nr:unknown [Lotus japonicus]